MSEPMPKYLIFGAEDLDKLNKFINNRTKEGYKLQAIQPYQGIGGYVFLVYMYLDVGNYEDVTNLKDVPPEEVDTHIMQGWEIASASISTKFVRMVKRRKEI